METLSKEGGLGGALRRRPFRRAPSTPYDRPPTALRGAKGGGHAAQGGGLISRIVDPASRLITSGASRLFSSVFRKRLAAPPQTQVVEHQSGEDASQIACSIPSLEIPNGYRVGEEQTNTGSSGIAELETLLEQKTFTRVEFDRLAELLRSRTVESLKAEHENNNNEKMEEATVSVQEGKIGSSKVDGSLTIQKQILKDEVASPAEVAKVYMDMRPLNVSSSAGSFRNPVSGDTANLSTPSTSKQFDVSVAPRLALRFSGIPEHLEDGSQLARPPGRSALYRMSRSPYFKAGELSRDGYSYQSSSQWTPTVMKSGGRQALKRGSSALDGEFGSVGPIRRIRQKSNLMSRRKDAQPFLPGSCLSSPPTHVSREPVSVQRPLHLDGQNHATKDLLASEDGKTTAAMPPSQSSETAQKLFQQLDRLFPSPKDKSSELKNITREESPSELTHDMLHGSARISMEDVSSSMFFSMQENGKMDAGSASRLPHIWTSHSLKPDAVENNGPSESVGAGVKLAFDANGASRAFSPSKVRKTSMKPESMTASNPIAVTVPKMPAFQMSAPEDPLELDDDDYNAINLSKPLTTSKDDAGDKMSEHNVISETTTSENFLATASHGVPASTSTLFRKDDKKAPIKAVVTEKTNGFVFPDTSDSGTQSQPPLTSTLLTSHLDSPNAQREQMTSSIFTFGSNDAKSPAFSSTTITVNETAGIKVNEGSQSETTPVTSASATLAQGSIFHKSEAQKAGDTFKSFGNTVSSGTFTSSTPANFAFGASSVPSPSNGSLHSSSSSFSVPGTASVTCSEGHASAISSGSTATSSSLSTSSVSAAAATFSTVPSFQFGSGISAPVSASQPLEKFNSAIPLESSVKAASFSIPSSIVQSPLALFPSTGSHSSSDFATSNAVFSSSSSPSAPSTSLPNSGVSTSSAPSSAFSSTVGNSFSLAPSSAFPGTDGSSSIFGLSASGQSTGSSPSFDNISSQNSTKAPFGASGLSTISSQLFASNASYSSAASAYGASNTSHSSAVSAFGASNASHSSAASAFAATSGLKFGSQTTLSGTGASQLSESSTSQFGSCSSSPSFGLGNSSAGSFGGSPFGSVTSGAFASSTGFSFSAGAGSSGANGSSSFTSSATSGLFGSSSQASTSSLFASAPSSNTSPSTGFSFGLSASGSSGSPFAFGSSSSVFSFTSSGTTALSISSAPTQVFGASKPAIAFVSNSPGNDQMNEDNMTDDTNQAAAPSVPTFGQSANQLPAAPFLFSSQPVQPAQQAFQFSGQQNPSFPQNSSPFQPAGGLEFNAGGSFSLGSGGGDKSARKMVKPRRDKMRRK